MALPTIAVASAAVDSLYAVLANRKTRPGNRSAVATLQEIRATIVNAYAADVTVAISDTTDADAAAAFLVGGEVGAAFGRACVAGDIFATSGGTADFTDNALATAKGGAVASGDRFEVLSSSTVGYLGTATEVSFSDEEVVDFAGKAGS